MLVGFVRIYDGDSVVDSHDSEEEDKKGTGVVVVHLHEPLPIHCDEQ